MKPMFKAGGGLQVLQTPVTMYGIGLRLRHGIIV